MRELARIKPRALASKAHAKQGACNSPKGTLKACQHCILTLPNCLPTLPLMRPGQPKTYHSATKLSEACLHTRPWPPAAPATATWLGMVVSRVHRSIPARSVLRA